MACNPSFWRLKKGDCLEFKASLEIPEMIDILGT